MPVSSQCAALVVDYDVPAREWRCVGRDGAWRRVHMHRVAASCRPLGPGQWVWLMFDEAEQGWLCVDEAPPQIFEPRAIARLLGR